MSRVEEILELYVDRCIGVAMDCPECEASVGIVWVKGHYKNRDEVLLSASDTELDKLNLQEANAIKECKECYAKFAIEVTTKTEIDVYRLTREPLGHSLLSHDKNLNE